MVLPTILCDPTINPSQVDGSDRDVGCTGQVDPAALHQYFRGTINHLPTDLPPAVLVVRFGLFDPWMDWTEGGGVTLYRSRADWDCLLLRVPLCAFAIGWPIGVRFD